MNITINRAELLHAARRAASIAPSDSPMDVLKGTLLEAEGSRLTLTATNMEISLEQRLACPILEEDAVVVNAKLLTGMLEKLAGDTVELCRESGREQMYVRGGEAEYLVPVRNRNSFPRLEIPFPEDTVKVSGIPSIAKRTIFAAAKDGEKPLLKCVNLMFTRDGLRAAGSNGSCVVTAKGDDKCAGDIQMLVPASSLEKLARICGDTDEFRVGTTGKAIVFFKENFAFSARLLEGSYIDTDQLTGAVQNQFAVLTGVQDLRKALDSVICLDAEGKVQLQFEGQRLKFSCSSEQGNTSSSMEVIPLTGIPQGEYCYLAGQLMLCLRSLSGTATLGVAQGGMLTLSTEDAFYMQTAMRPSAAVRSKEGRTSAKKAA